MKFYLKYAVPFLLLNSTLHAQNTDSLFLRASIVKLVHAKEYTIHVAELMPSEKYSFRPVAGEMTFGEQLLHLSENMKWLCSSYLDSAGISISKIDKPYATKECIITYLGEIYSYAINVLQKFDPAHLPDSVSFFAGPMNKLQIINLLNDHQTHHRAQLLVYLRLNGFKPPDYVGW